MLIWDIIRDWFVMNIWGGTTSTNDSYLTSLGAGNVYINGVLDESGFYTMQDYQIYVGGAHDTTFSISLADWLSTTSTIIILVAVSVGLYFLTRYFFRMFAGLLAGR